MQDLKDMWLEGRDENIIITRSVEVYIHRSSPTLRGIVVLNSIYQIRWIKKCRFINGHNFFWNFRETKRHFSLCLQNSEYPRIFQVMGANQNARKLLSTDLVNTKTGWWPVCTGQIYRKVLQLTTLHQPCCPMLYFSRSTWKPGQLQHQLT